MRNLTAEVFVSDGGSAANLLWDIDKFYVSIDITMLIKCATDANYPKLPLALGVQLYMAPKYIKVADCAHTGIIPCNGVAAGCTQAASLSKSMLYDIVEHMHYFYVDRPIDKPVSGVEDNTYT